MHETFKILEDRLKFLQQTKAWLSRQIDTPTQNINNWKSRGIPAKQLKKVSDAVQLPRYVFEEGLIDSDLITGGYDLAISQEIVIPRYSQAFSMGGGVLDINQDVEIKYFVTNRNWIAENLKHASAVKNICIITGEGNSMSPTIKDGAAVFLDLGVTSHIGDFVYAIKTQNDQLLIKQVNLLSTGEYCLISHNEFSPNETVETVSIIGKVIGAMNFDEL